MPLAAPVTIATDAAGSTFAVNAIAF